LRSYAASNGEDFAIKEEDHLVGLIEANTTDKILLFTNKGKYLYLPVHELPDIRWKDIGQHVSNIVQIDKDEYILQILPVREFKEGEFLVFFTKNGMVKRSELKIYEAQRHSKALIALNLKNDDEVISVCQTKGYSDLFIASNKGYGLWYHESEVPVVGQRATGVKAIQLKEGEYVVGGQVFDDLSEPSLVVVTQRGACKRMKLREFEKSSRAKRGLLMLRELKNKPHRIVGFFATYKNDTICFSTTKGERHHFLPLDLSNSDRYSNGSFVIDSDTQGEVVEVWKEVNYEKPFDPTLD